MTTNETTPHFGFPLPVASNDLSVDVDNLRAAIMAFDLQLYGVFNDLAAKAATGHSHAITDVQDLQTTLDELSSRTAPENLNDLSDVDAASPVTGHFVKWQGSVWVPAKITLSDVENLTTGLNQKSNTGHSHTVADITDYVSATDARIQAIVGAAPDALDTLVELGASLNNDPDFAATMTTALAGKAAVGHSHSWGEITGKPSTFPPSSHSHSWGSITGKPSTFPPSSHSHSWGSITGKPTVAEVYTGSSVNQTSFPVGHTILLPNNGSPNRNASTTVRIDSGDSRRYTFSGGTALAGTWRSRGAWGSTLMERTA